MKGDYPRFRASYQHEGLMEHFFLHTTELEFAQGFRGELTHYLESQKKKGATYLFESNRLQPYSTRRIRQIIKQYALEAGITKRVYPHLFRHQIITYLTKHGIISPKLQLLSGHAEEKSLAIYRDLALADVAGEYEEAMKTFPVK